MTTPIIQHERRGDLTILHLRTPSIDAVSASAIEQYCTDMQPVTVLDFADVTFINSAGISVLLKFVVSARRAGYQLYAMNLSPHHQKIFKTVEMSRFMPLVTDHDLAMTQHG